MTILDYHLVCPKVCVPPAGPFLPSELLPCFSSIVYFQLLPITLLLSEVRQLFLKEGILAAIVGALYHFVLLDIVVLSWSSLNWQYAVDLQDLKQTMAPP
jgi:hypothetical protein